MKKIFIIAASVFLIFEFAIITLASDTLNVDEIEESINQSLFSAMDDELKNSFSGIGIDSIDYEKIYSVSFTDIVTFFTPQILQRFEGIFKSFLQLFVLVIIMSIASVLLKESSGESVLFFLGTVIAVLLSTESVSCSLNSCLSVLRISGGFMVSYIPILTLIISLSGNVNLAMTYNTFTLAVSEIISAVINSGLTDIVGCLFCLGISFSLCDDLSVSRLVNGVNKTVNFFLGLSGSIFAGLLSVKSIMAVSADGVAVKGIRFLISSLIPVVGSVISEAYSSLIGSINLIKGSVAVIGMLAVLIINLPVIAETLMYHISFSMLSYLSEVCSCNALSDFFKVVCCAVRILMIAVIFEMFILLISTGIMLSFRGAV